VRPCLIIALSVALTASGGQAQPAAPQQERQQQEPDSSEQPAQVVFASADEAETPQDERDQQPEVSRPRPHGTARVTTCRCGDPQHN
jgi:hypothetical protein